MTIEHLQERRNEIQENMDAISEEIQKLDELRQEGYANLQALSGALQILDELIAKETTSSE